ncbi:MAG: FeoB-associated Cys-rich membrane protein [Clostridia bacterium]|nr:FeoB-associated Cys-rich membrane protein [Clostridia bacterium]
MHAWFAANIGTVLIALALAAVVAGIIFKLRKDKKKGVSSCGGNCAHCAMGCACCRTNDGAQKQ